MYITCVLIFSSLDAGFKEEDLANSLLHCVTDQMTQTLYLVGKAQGLARAIVCGSYLHGNQGARQQIETKLNESCAFLRVRGICYITKETIP